MIQKILAAAFVIFFAFFNPFAAHAQDGGGSNAAFTSLKYSVEGTWVSTSQGQRVDVSVNNPTEDILIHTLDKMPSTLYGETAVQASANPRNIGVNDSYGLSARNQFNQDWFFHSYLEVSTGSLKVGAKFWQDGTYSMVFENHTGSTVYITVAWDSNPWLTIPNGMAIEALHDVAPFYSAYKVSNDLKTLGTVIVDARFPAAPITTSAEQMADGRLMILGYNLLDVPQHQSTNNFVLIWPGYQFSTDTEIRSNPLGGGWDDYQIIMPLGDNVPCDVPLELIVGVGGQSNLIRGQFVRRNCPAPKQPVFLTYLPLVSH